MLSTKNVLRPADGQPVVTPRQDMVLGTYWLTLDADTKQQPRIFGDFAEVQSAFDLGLVTYHTPVKVPHNGGVVDTTVGRVLFNAVLPEELRFVNKILDRGAIREIVTAVFDRYGGEVTAEVVDRIKTIGFSAATVAGVSISIDDVAIPKDKQKMIDEAETKVAEIDRQFQRGLITEQERYEATVKLWTDATRNVIDAMMRTLDRRGSVYMMATSGARGNTQQMGQIGGMRGLIADPQGRIKDPKSGKVIVKRGNEIDLELSRTIASSGVKRVRVRSPLGCHAKHGICRACYGRSLASGKLVEVGEAVGIIAAQSIGEPGTQLTMRTFHTGGIAGKDITMGLPRVEELFEARVPKGVAVVCEIDGIAEIVRDPDGSRKIVVRNSQDYTVPISVPSGYVLAVEDGADVIAGTPIAKPERRTKGKTDMPAPVSGKVSVHGSKITIAMKEVEERIYEVEHTARLSVEEGQEVSAGDFLTDGSANPQDILRISGREAVHRYMVNEVQKVYRSQGVTINDKHIEIIVRQLIPAGTGLASRREQLDWMPKARALAGLFGAEEEEVIPVLPPEELSLEDLDDDDEDEEGGEGLEELAEPTAADLTKTED